MAKKIVEQKVTGNIFGFSNLYLKIPFFGKLEACWSASIRNYEVNGFETTMSFYWEGSFYQFKLRDLDKDGVKFQGKIFMDGEEYGKVYLTCYSNKFGKIFKGSWIEVDSNSDVHIELNFN